MRGDGYWSEVVWPTVKTAVWVIPVLVFSWALMAQFLAAALGLEWHSWMILAPGIPPLLLHLTAATIAVLEDRHSTD